jgi:Fur family ferric uptake transcriptional regulator
VDGRVDGIMAELDRRGFRDTLPRRLIVQAVCAQARSFTAQEIADELQPRGIGRATVFRALQVLQDTGHLSRLHVGEECHRYAVCDASHHHHMVCTRCGQVFPFDACTIEEQAEATAQTLNFRVRGHHVDIYGECAACQVLPPT